MRNKKAYTLVELMVVMSISIVLLSVCTRTIVTGIKEYLLNTEYSIKQDNFDNCLLNIDNLLRSSYLESIEEDSDRLIITINVDRGVNFIKKKVIHLKDSKLMVTTYSSSNTDISTGNNVLLREVKSFEVVRKENLIYYSITTTNGDTRVKCI